MKIHRLEAENVKRVRAVMLEPKPEGLTIIGGKNRQGKTSVLDAIAWALGGDKYRPDAPTREGSAIPPTLKVILSNGIVVERKGKNSDLTVTDPQGDKAGQKLLDAFVEKLALDLPRFMGMSDKEKANVLLKIIGVEEELAKLRLQEKQQYDERTMVGRIAEQKKAAAKDLAYYPDAPKEPVSAMDLIQEQQEILARNGANQKLRNEKADLERHREETLKDLSSIDDQMKALEIKRAGLFTVLKGIEEMLDTASKTVEQLVDESTAEIEKSLMDIEAINIKVRSNLDKDKADEDAKQYVEQYNLLSSQLDKTRADIIALLDGAALPLPDLGINEANELTYKGHTWGDMSSAEQLQVATAIVRKLNPECGFVLIDRLEAMDIDELKRFGEWLEKEGLQAICTRVSTGDECTITITDGLVDGRSLANPEAPETKSWKEGTF